MAAHAAGVQRIIHLSEVGAYRWSPNPLNRASFKIDRNVRILKDLPWVMFRFSIYSDEIIEGCVRPPDGGKPHGIRQNARYSPISRADCARVVIDMLPNLHPSRTYYVGGPKTYGGIELGTPGAETGDAQRLLFGRLVFAHLSGLASIPM